MSGLLNKVKNVVTGEKNTPEAAAANQGNNGMCPSYKFDHRTFTKVDISIVDYDRTGANTGYAGSGNYGSGTTEHGVTGSGGPIGSGSTTSGPHSSNMENKLDPRVDSGKSPVAFYSFLGADSLIKDNSRGTSGGYGSTGTHHTTAGPHSSDLANKADPRVDSDRGNFAAKELLRSSF